MDRGVGQQQTKHMVGPGRAASQQDTVTIIIVMRIIAPFMTKNKPKPLAVACVLRGQPSEGNATGLNGDFSESRLLTCSKAGTEVKASGRHGAARTVLLRHPGSDYVQVADGPGKTALQARAGTEALAALLRPITDANLHFRNTICL